ncbi:LPS export ABC transporter permease LptG [Marinomonas spartinae]|uniref:LPS export ABC transporter permease LptG n=1 Tax=Marinomonas spartinae TaxID=1792290 RepID=UPI0018F1E3DA|nr:LPS export ABC transporter permease LptG [Marinomonas spartinae]MBJ7556970.1 LPS export ABC transporter permease LptG [Marinomonas spartinae]
MNKIDRYIATSVLWAFLIVIFVLLGLDYALTFIDKIKQVDDHYPISSLLQVLFFRLPGKLAQYIPIASLIGTLMGLGTLASTSELTVMRAAGLPIWRIGLAACQPILLVSLIGLAISEYVAPVAEQKANLIEQIRDQQDTNFALTGGVWLKADKKFVYINAADNTGKLYGIIVYTPENETLKRVIRADTATHKAGNQWTLHNVRETLFFPDHTEAKSFKTMDWSVSIKPEHLFLASQDPDSLSLSQLSNYKNYLEAQHQDASQYALEFWQKALRPLGSLALVLVALSSVFGPLRSSTMGGRIFSGVMIGLAFQNGLNLFGQMSVAAHFPPVIGVSIPIVLCTLAALYLMRRKG